MLNVAASRTKRKLYVIGDKHSWQTRPYFNELARVLPIFQDLKTNKRQSAHIWNPISFFNLFSFLLLFLCLTITVLLRKDKYLAEKFSYKKSILFTALLLNFPTDVMLLLEISSSIIA